MPAAESEVGEVLGLMAAVDSLAVMDASMLLRDGLELLRSYPELL